MVFLLHNDGGIFQYTGTPFAWEQIDNNPATVAIFPPRYLLHNDGGVFQYTGTPFAWQQIDNNPANTAITDAQGFGPFVLHNDGSGIFQYTGTPFAWNQVDGNPATVSIAAALIGRVLVSICCITMAAAFSSIQGRPSRGSRSTTTQPPSELPLLHLLLVLRIPSINCITMAVFGEINWARARRPYRRCPACGSSSTATQPTAQLLLAALSINCTMMAAFSSTQGRPSGGRSSTATQPTPQLPLVLWVVVVVPSIYCITMAAAFSST